MSRRDDLKAADLYPFIHGLLDRHGLRLELGGMVRDTQAVDSTETSTYNWDYGVTNERLRRLYERAREAQWDAADLPWETSVDLESDVFRLDPAWEAADWFRKMGRRERQRVVIGYNANLLSNFIHGEQGALTAAAQLVSAVPDVDGKLYAASQTFDEARHVEVFSRYVREKMPEQFPCTQNLFNLIQAITVESRWDFKFLGMQLIVEGLAVAAFLNLRARCGEPLLRELIRLVVRDEARHVAFGAISLDGYYTDMSEAERRERQEFVYEACVLMQGRLVSGDAYERMGVHPEQVKETLRDSQETRHFLALLFSQVVPNLKRVGLLEGWLAERLAEMDLLRYKDFDADAVLNQLIRGEDLEHGLSRDIAG